VVNVVVGKALRALLNEFLAMRQEYDSAPLGLGFVDHVGGNDRLAAPSRCEHNHGAMTGSELGASRSNGIHLIRS
jgi:hypothetical protein